MKQQPYDQRDSLLLKSDDDLFVGDDEWRKEQDRRYMAASHQAWSAMTPSDIAREGYMKRTPASQKKMGRSAQRKAEAEKRRQKEGLYPSPTPDDLKALRNK
jgi:hypothetical protein